MEAPSSRRQQIMTVNEVKERILHYQRSIDRSTTESSDTKRLLYCIGQLSGLPVTVLHLEETGIGRTVNSLRKLEHGVGDAARILVSKWKDMVSRSSNEEDDEACVPDVPESYESPDNDSESESTAAHDTCVYTQNGPETLIPPLPLGDLEINDDIESFDYLKNDTTSSISNEKEESKDKYKNKSSSHSSKHNSKISSSKDKRDSDKKSHHKDKNGSSSGSKDKQESSRISKESDLNKSKKKDKNKNKYESCSSSSSTSSIKDKKCLENKKRKHDSIGEDGGSNRKKSKETSSDEEEEGSGKNNIIIYDQESEEENEDEEEIEEEIEEDEEEKEEIEEEEKTSMDEESRKESSRKGTSSHSDKSKSKDKHHSNSSHRSKSKESSDKLKKEEKRSSSKSHEREKDEKNSKESSKSKKSHSSSSSKNYSKHKDKDKSKSKHSKDKESSSKDRKSEKEKNSDKVNKDDKGKSGENKERKDSKEPKESKERKNRHKDGKEHKKQKDSEDNKEQIKEKRTSVEDEGGIDCYSGTSFAEALGMCPIPPKTKRKKENPSPSPSLPKRVKIEPSSSSHVSSPSSSKNKLFSSSQTKSEPPDSPESLPLLSSNVTLEPLSKIKEEIDLASTLPEPSPHYRPLPQVNHIQRKLEEDQVLAQVIYAKNQRTKVFSGNKTGYTTVPSLYEMCIRVLIENIDALEFTGGVPYYIIKPILERASPDQLYMLEHHNPYLTEDTDPLWQFHCNKDFRTKKREEMESWREMYLRCLDEREAKLKALTANIKQSIDKSAPVRSTKLAYIDHMVKPPRNVLRQQAKYGTANTTIKSSDLKKKLIIAAASGLSASSSSSLNSSSSSSSSGTASVERISVPAPPPARVRHAAPVKKVKAPLMAKALQAIKGRYKR